MQSGQPAAQVVPINSKNVAGVKDRAKLARLPAPAHHVREKGKQAISKALQKVFDNADDALFTLADKATNNQEQNLFFESMREVRIRRRHMEAKFATAIDEAFARLLSDKPDLPSSDEYLADQEISLDDISLVKNDDLEELVAVDTMVTKANTACGESLQMLSLRLDSLVPSKVYQKNNPLGPQVVCQSFINTAKDLDADIKAKLVLFKLFDQYVVANLPRIIEMLNQVLIGQGVLPSMQQNKRAPKRRDPRVTSSGPVMVNGKSVEDMTPQESVNAAEVTLNALRGLMHGQGQSAPNGSSTLGSMPSGSMSASPMSSGATQNTVSPQTMSAGFGETVSPMGSGFSNSNGSYLGGDELVTTLSQLQSQQQASWQQQGVNSNYKLMDVNGFINQMLQSQGGQKSLGTMENDVINLVKMLFEFILDDRNLAAPLKAILGRLQIPMLKVALMDKSFFSKAGHPARRLLNEMATAALGWEEDPKNEGEPKDPLYKKICSIVQTLLGEFESDVSLFTDMLTDFVAFIDREKRRASVLERRTLDAEDGKAKAEAARAQVAQALEEKTAGKTLPKVVNTLIENAWSNVLFLISLRDGVSSDNWRDALKTAENLIWSVTAEVNQESRSQLIGMIPTIIKNLKIGLEKISYNPFETTQLLGQLEKIHMQRLQAPEKTKVVDEPSNSGDQAANAEVKPVKPAPANPQPEQVQNSEKAVAETKGEVEAKVKQAEPTAPAVVKPVQQQPAEQKSANANTNVQKANSAKDTTLVSAQDAKAVETIDESYLALVSKLTQGSWFELDDGKQHYRCRLAAIIKATGKYIFVNRNGMKVAEESRDTLAIAMKKGDLRLLDDSMLFDRALESVIGSLRDTRTA